MEERIEQEKLQIEENREKLAYAAKLDNQHVFDVCIQNIEEHEQLAELLEELKFLRQWKSDVMEEFCKYDCNSVEEARHNGYNKAIDDFVNFANTMPTVEEEDGGIRPMRLEEMAEQLKTQVNIPQSITRTQIMNCLNSYVKDNIVDAQWHISLVNDFMPLLNGDIFDADKLVNWNYIKSVIQNNKDSEYAKKVLMRKTPEMYIACLFHIIVDNISNNAN